MGKKKNKKKKIQADDYFSFGSFEMARFGNLNIYRNKMTNEQYKEMQSKLIERYPQVCNEIDDKILSIVEDINKYEPTEILFRAYWEMAVNNLDIESEIDVDQNAATSLRMVDYIQSIIASTPSNAANFDKLSEKEWDSLKNKVKDLFSQLNIEYQICRTLCQRKESEKPDPEFEEYYYKAQIYWCNIRGHRYLYHEKEHFQDLLTPHSNIINELFGITSEQLINEISKIQHALTKGIIDAGLELKEFQKKTMDAIDVKIKTQAIPPDISDLMKDVIKENSWEEWAKSIFGRFSGLDLFNIEKVTTLPKSLLEELSWSQGEDVDFFSEGEFKGWPLRIWPIFKRPFIKLNNHYYCFELYSFMDNFYRVMQRTIIRLKKSYQKEWNDKQKEISEKLPFKYLKKILPQGQIYQSIYYQWYTNSSKKKQWCEADGILIYEDHLFIIEVKAGSFTYTSPANDFPAYIESIKNLIFKPATQGNRFIKYLESASVVDLYDADHSKIGEISKDNFKHIHICAVTLDSFTELASQAQHLKKLGVDIKEHPVWSISIDDLRVYSDIFSNPLIFLHFVEERMRAFKSNLIKTEDELDHLGLYLKHNIYTQYVKTFNSNKPIIWHGYREDIDKFFTDKLHNPNTPCPLKQEIPQRLKEIIDLLVEKNIPNRRKIASSLLNCSETFRNNITSGIDNVLIQQRNTGTPKALSTHGTINISIFCWQIGVLERDKNLAREHSQATMLINNDNERLLIEILINETGLIYDIKSQVLKINTIEEEKLAEIKILAEKLKKKRVKKSIKNNGKIGRNDPCPCGSGKKHKKCCLK